MGRTLPEFLEGISPEYGKIGGIFTRVLWGIFYLSLGGGILPKFGGGYFFTLVWWEVFYLSLVGGLPEFGGVVLFVEYTGLVADGDPVTTDLVLHVGRVACAVK